MGLIGNCVTLKYHRNLILMMNIQVRFKDIKAASWHHVGRQDYAVFHSNLMKLLTRVTEFWVSDFNCQFNLLTEHNAIVSGIQHSGQQPFGIIVSLLI